ncbi:hypothetical protein KY318_03455, partial [Candidatus Woesearchaeota archaeon]|nr:hypothetical protein [Candidatus Woesearchaeota archaeon]
MRVPREYIIAAKYLLIASAIFVVLYFGGKGIIGLVIYGPTKEQTLDVGAHFYGDDVFYTQLEEFGVLEGVSVDGYFNGTGKALVYLEIGNQSFLVLDTTKIATRETTQNQTAPPMVTGYVVAEESEPTGETSQDSDTQEESQPEQEEETPSESEPAVEEEPVSEEEEATQEEGGETQEEGVEESAETPTTTEETSEGEQATEEEEATQEEGGEAAEETTQETTTTIEEESQPSPENETQTETTETTTTVAETGEANETQEQPVTKETTTTVTEESEPIVINETQEQPTTEETTTTVAEAPAEELVGGNVSYENQTLSNVTLPEPENQTKAVVVNETTEEAGVNESMGNLTTQINQTQAVNVSENKT